jgi:hypothetical protein
MGLAKARARGQARARARARAKEVQGKGALAREALAKGALAKEAGVKVPRQATAQGMVLVVSRAVQQGQPAGVGPPPHA